MASNLSTLLYDPLLLLKLAAAGEERPTAFASHSLSASEKNFPQIDKEALSLVYDKQNFHLYL